MMLATTNGVTKRFGTVMAVDTVDLQVHTGEVVGLLGANGAGKTTLIKLLLGLLRMSEGGVSLFGERPSRRTRAQLGYVPQGLGLYEDLTVEQNLSFAAAVFGQGNGLDEELAHLRVVLVRDLPLGLRRRVSFAQALAHNPKLLVLDEPTSGVDPLARTRLWDTIREAAETGAGVLVTTHHMEEAEECDRLVVMSQGAVVASGTIDDIVAGAKTVVVAAEQWDAAFDALDELDAPLALIGRDLRLPGSEVEDVQRALSDAGIDAEVRLADATFEEVFASLVMRPRQQSAVGGSR
jgi:ABC-2 type transport system ATP-binding protein/ribosome-dependent ATPase